MCTSGSLNRSREDGDSVSRKCISSICVQLLVIVIVLGNFCARNLVKQAVLCPTCSTKRNVNKWYRCRHVRRAAIKTVMDTRYRLFVVCLFFGGEVGMGQVRFRGCGEVIRLGFR